MFGSEIHETGIVPLKTRIVTVTAGRGDIGIAKVFVEIDFLVSVEVVQNGNLVFAQSMDLPIDDEQSKRLVHPWAIRFQRTDFKSRSRPRTSQTSPKKVDTAASPLGKKSSPLRNMGER